MRGGRRQLEVACQERLERRMRLALERLLLREGASALLGEPVERSSAKRENGMRRACIASITRADGVSSGWLNLWRAIASVWRYR